MHRYYIYRTGTSKYIGQIDAHDSRDAVWKVCRDSGADPANYYAVLALSSEDERSR